MICRKCFIQKRFFSFLLKQNSKKIFKLNWSMPCVSGNISYHTKWIKLQGFQILTLVHDDLIREIHQSNNLWTFIFGGYKKAQIMFFLEWFGNWVKSDEKIEPKFRKENTYVQIEESNGKFRIEGNGEKEREKCAEPSLIFFLLFSLIFFSPLFCLTRKIARIKNKKDRKTTTKFTFTSY